MARSVSFDDFRQIVGSETPINVRFLTLVNTYRLVTKPSNPEKLILKEDISMNYCPQRKKITLICHT
ncbi:hypothetical protein CAL7716_025530 [Calothrix sp. PCC 7716]|nr:hypothetical protein CAL7716_025530 [Calothrix sp. PCC 7716]